MNIPFNWVDSSEDYEKISNGLTNEPEHSGKLNLWRRLRENLKSLKTFIDISTENEKKNFSNEDSTMRNTLNTIGTELDSLDSRITSAENSITSLTSMLSSTQQMLNRVDGELQELKDKVGGVS